MGPTLSLRTVLLAAAALVLAPVAADAQSRVRTGILDAGSPTWDRPHEAAGTSPTCQLVAQDDPTANGVSYVTFDIQVTETEDLTAEVVEAGTSHAFDPMLFLYCAPFDPLQPLANLVASNDDSFTLDPLPAFTADDHITLQPGQTYTMVLTTFNPADFGQYELALTSPTASFVPEPEAGGIAAALALGLLARRRHAAVAA
jgi:hypothetical protein